MSELALCVRQRFPPPSQDACGQSGNTERSRPRVASCGGAFNTVMRSEISGWRYRFSIFLLRHFSIFPSRYFHIPSATSFSNLFQKTTKRGGVESVRSSNYSLLRLEPPLFDFSRSQPKGLRISLLAGFSALDRRTFLVYFPVNWNFHSESGLLKTPSSAV